MAFGVEWKNNSSALVVSTEKYGLASIGNATYTGVEKPEAYKQIGYGGAGYSGVGEKFYIYTIESSSTPVVFLQLLTSYFAVTSIEYMGGTSWQIVVGGGNWATVPAMKCFARLVGPGGSGFGARFYDAAGNRTWDTTAAMLVMARRDIWAAASDSTSATMQQTISMTDVPNPFIMSSAQCSIAAVRASGSPVGGLYTMNDYIAGWALLPGGTLSRGTTAVRTSTWRDDSRIFYNTLPACRTYLINGNLY